MGVAASHQQIPLPMTGHGTIFCLSGALSDRNRIADLSAPWAVVGVTAAAPQRTTAAQVRGKLFSQYSARLDEQALVDRLVRKPHTFIVAIFPCKPSGNLLRRPLQLQLLGDQAGQLRISGQVAWLWPERSIPCPLIRSVRSIAPRQRGVAGDLSADGRGRSSEASRDVADPLVSPPPPRDLLTLGESQGEPRAATLSRSHASVYPHRSQQREVAPAHRLGHRRNRLPG